MSFVCILFWIVKEVLLTQIFIITLRTETTRPYRQTGISISHSQTKFFKLYLILPPYLHTCSLSGFRPNILSILISPKRLTCPSQPIFLEFITQTIFRKWYLRNYGSPIYVIFWGLLSPRLFWGHILSLSSCSWVSSLYQSITPFDSTIQLYRQIIKKLILTRRRRCDLPYSHLHHYWL